MQENKDFDQLNQTGILTWVQIKEQLATPKSLPKTITLHLVRHAESLNNVAGLITGNLDIKLSTGGEKQASLLGQKLDNYYDIAFCSMLERSRKTLQIAVEDGQVTVKNSFEDARLNERNFGELQGQKHFTLKVDDFKDLNYAPQQGESYVEVARRIFSFLIAFLDWVKDTNFSKVLICGHMGMMRILVGILEDEKNISTVVDYHFSNAKIIEFELNKIAIPDFLKGHI